MRLTVLNVGYPLAQVSSSTAGGAEQVLAALDAGLVRAGHRSVVLAPEGSRCRGLLIPTPVAASPLTDAARHRAQIQYREALANALARFSIDVVHLHGIDLVAPHEVADHLLHPRGTLREPSPVGHRHDRAEAAGERAAERRVARHRTAAEIGRMDVVLHLDAAVRQVRQIVERRHRADSVVHDTAVGRLPRQTAHVVERTPLWAADRLQRLAGRIAQRDEDGHLAVLGQIEDPAGEGLVADRGVPAPDPEVRGGKHDRHGGLPDVVPIRVALVPIIGDRDDEGDRRR